MKAFAVTALAASAFAAQKVATTLNKKCMECIYEGHSFCDLTAIQMDTDRTMKSSESCMPMGQPCPANHMAMRSFNLCNDKKYFTNKKTCKDVEIND